MIRAKFTKAVFSDIFYNFPVSIDSPAAVIPRKEGQA